MEKRPANHTEAVDLFIVGEKKIATHFIIVIFFVLKTQRIQGLVVAFTVLFVQTGPITFSFSSSETQQ